MLFQKNHQEATATMEGAFSDFCLRRGTWHVIRNQATRWKEDPRKIPRGPLEKVVLSLTYRLRVLAILPGMIDSVREQKIEFNAGGSA